MSQLIVSLVVTYILAISLVTAYPSGSSQSACQEHRAREQRLNSTLNLVPECEDNGDYKAKQCHGPSTNGKRFCQCWTTNGDIITSPSRNTVACECHREKHAAINPIRVGSFIPQCEANGTYSKKQCHGSTGYCWCANENGVRSTENTRGPLECP